MKYKIIDFPKYTNAVSIGLEIEPENEPLKYFFSSVKLENMPVVLGNVINSVGFSEEKAGVIYYDDLDGYDISTGQGFESSQVRIYHEVFGDTLVETKLFEKILYDYCIKLIDKYKDDNSISINWFNEMQQKLQRLNHKLNFS